MEGRVVKWGILGTARIAQKLLKAIERAPSAEVVAVASRSLERAEEWSAANGLADSVTKYGNYTELLSDNAVEVIYVPLPTSLHKEWVVKCANAGKHVLVEKPVGLNAEEVSEMIAACESNNVQFMDGVMFMHHVRLEKMKQVLKNPDIVGELKRMTSSFTFNGGDTFMQSDIRVKKDLDALGCVGDLGWYQVRAALWAYEDDPTEVYGLAHAQTAEGVVLSASATLLFPHGRMAVMDCGFDTNVRQTLELAGTKASLRCDDFVLCSQEDRSAFIVNTQVFDGMTPPQREETPYEGGACCQEERMVQALSVLAAGSAREGEWGRLTLRTQRVVDAILLSIHDAGRPQPVAPTPSP